MHSGIFGERAVAAACGDRLEGYEEGELLYPSGIGGELQKERGRCIWKTSTKVLAES